MTDKESGENRPSLADRRDVETVYQPAEDSRLLAETAIEGVDSDMLVLDVGTGSGYVADRLQTETGAAVAGSDLNPDAVRQAGRTVPVVRGNLLAPFRANSFDVVVCNPPYLPTPPDQEWGDWMEHALSGGDDGRAVVEPFLDDVGRVLVPDGVAYLLVSSLTDPDAVRAVATDAGLQTETVAEESHPFERLLVLRLTPTK